jgi:hypothetical protein
VEVGQGAYVVLVCVLILTRLAAPFVGLAASSGYL